MLAKDFKVGTKFKRLEYDWEVEVIEECGRQVFEINGLDTSEYLDEERYLKIN